MNPFILSLLGCGAAVGAAFSARWNWWRPKKEGIPILMYHKVGEPPPGSTMPALWVSKEKFRNHLSTLSKEGYHPITFKDIYNHWDQDLSMPPKPVLITFDDGYANNYTEAFPIMRDFGFRGVVFVVVQTVGWDNRWHDPESETRIPMISWPQLKEIQSAGWEVGSHTLNHRNLTKLGLDAVRVEVGRSRQILSDFLEQTPNTFAYPYGQGEDDSMIRDIVKSAGYRLAVGVHAGKWTWEKIKAEPYHLPRIYVRGDESLFDFHLQLTRGRCRL